MKSNLSLPRPFKVPQMHVHRSSRVFKGTNYFPLRLFPLPLPLQTCMTNSSDSLCLKYLEWVLPSWLEPGRSRCLEGESLTFGPRPGLFATLPGNSFVQNVQAECDGSHPARGQQDRFSHLELSKPASLHPESIFHPRLGHSFIRAFTQHILESFLSAENTSRDPVREKQDVSYEKHRCLFRVSRQNFRPQLCGEVGGLGGLPPSSAVPPGHRRQGVRAPLHTPAQGCRQQHSTRRVLVK